MKQEISIFYPLLEYEINSAERHSRYVSLLMISSKEDLPRVKAIVSDNVRKTDVYSSFDHSIVILMGETQKTDALGAADRFKRLFPEDQDLRFAIATYPDDEVKPEGLIRTAYDRLNKARECPDLPVVSED